MFQFTIAHALAGFSEGCCIRVKLPRYDPRPFDRQRSISNLLTVKEVFVTFCL